MILRIAKFVYRYGLWALVWKCLVRRYRPRRAGAALIVSRGVHRIGTLKGIPSLRSVTAWWLLRNANNIEIILTLVRGGGAAAYVDHVIKSRQAGEWSIVVKPTGLLGWLDVGIYEGDDNRLTCMIPSLDALGPLHGRCRTLTINHLIDWHSYYDTSNQCRTHACAHLVDDILCLKEDLGAAMTYMIHDYFCVCPKYQLMAQDGFYCRSEVTGERCKPCLAETGIDRKGWLSDFRRLLSACDEVRTFSEDTQKRIMAVFPGINPTVVPHRLLCDFRETPKLSRDGICIGVFGFIYPAKGSLQVIELGHYLKRIGSTVRIVVVGRLDPAGRAVPDNVKVLGEYKKEDLVQIIEREGINVAWFSSVCPETFSYVTHELMALGLPIVCYDVGAPKDCVREYGKGMVIPEMSVESTWKTIQELTAKMGVKQNA